MGLDCTGGPGSPVTVSNPAGGIIIFIIIIIISSDRSSYSDVGLLHTRTTFSDFHSVL